MWGGGRDGARAEGAAQGAGNVHMRPVWKLTEAQRSVNFRSSNLRGNVFWPILFGRQAVGSYGKSRAKRAAC